jgi:hypothetical protein
VKISATCCCCLICGAIKKRKRELEEKRKITVFEVEKKNYSIDAKQDLFINSKSRARAYFKTQISSDPHELIFRRFLLAALDANQ